MLIASSLHLWFLFVDPCLMHSLWFILGDFPKKIIWIFSLTYVHFVTSKYQMHLTCTPLLVIVSCNYRVPLSYQIILFCTFLYSQDNSNFATQIKISSLSWKITPWSCVCLKTNITLHCLVKGNCWKHKISHQFIPEKHNDLYWLQRQVVFTDMSNLW